MTERHWNVWTLLTGSASLISALGIAAIYGAVLRRIAINAYGATGDFLSFYSAGFLVRTGRAGHLYDPATLEWAQRHLYPGSFDEPIGYPLPVFVAWAFAPLSLLPFTAAFFIYIAAMAGLLCAMVLVLRHHLLDVPSLPRNVFLLAAACSMPAVASIVFGQVDLIVLAGLIAGYLLLRGGRKRAAGLALCVALVKPHLLIGVGLLLIVRRDWRVLGAMAATGIPLLVLPALLSAPGALIENVRIIASYPGGDTALSVNATVMPNWRGFVVSAFNNESVALWLPGSALIAATAVLAAIATWRRSKHLDRDFSIAAILPLLISPHVHTQNLVLLVLPAAIALHAYFAAGATPDRQMRAVNVLLIAYALAFFLPVIAIQGVSLGIFPLLALYAGLIARWPRTRSVDSELQPPPLSESARAA